MNVEYIRLSPSEVRYMAGVVNAFSGDNGARDFVLGTPEPKILRVYGLLKSTSLSVPMPTALGLAWYDAIFLVRRATENRHHPPPEPKRKRR